MASEPGKGTRLHALFPAPDGGAVAKQDDEPEGPVFHGAGTILVVEDEEALRELLVSMLKKLGYTVLVSASTAEALTIFAREKSGIVMLVSDIVMPVMNGVELQEKLLAQKPDLKTLFISGFPAEVVKAKGVLDTKMNFLPKPFTMKGLAGKMREIMAN